MERFIKSLNENKIGITIIIFTSVMTSLGQVFWKVSQVQGNTLVPLLLGFALYGIGTVLMILAFKFGSFSVIHPFLACGYVFALVWGNIFLGEIITLQQLLGILCVMIGVLFIGGGDE